MISWYSMQSPVTSVCRPTVSGTSLAKTSPWESATESRTIGDAEIGEDNFDLKDTAKDRICETQETPRPINL